MTGQLTYACCVHMQLNTTTTDPTLQVAAINQIAALNGVTSLTAPVLNTLTAATVNDPTVEAELAAALGFTNLYPLKASAAALATCTTPYIPAGNYTNLNVALTSALYPINSLTLKQSIALFEHP